VPGACLVGGIKLRVVLRGLVPLLLMLGPLVLSIMPVIVLSCRARVAPRADCTKTCFSEGLKAAVLRALPYMIFISFCLVQSVSAGIFSAWDCVQFVFDSASGTTRTFLREDLSIECDTEQHWQIKRIAFVFFAIWPVGMPLLYLLMLWPCRVALLEARSTPLTHATSFLHQEYTPQYFAWEPLFVLQRLAVTGFVMFFIPAQDAIWRIVLGIFTTIAYMALLLGCRPYRQPDLNVLAAIGAQFALALSMVTVLGMRIFDDITARYDLGGAQSIMRIDSKSQMVGVTISFAFLGLVMVGILSTHDTIVEATSLAKERVRRLSWSSCAPVEPTSGRKSQTTSSAEQGASDQNDHLRQHGLHSTTSDRDPYGQGSIRQQTAPIVV